MASGVQSSDADENASNNLVPNEMNNAADDRCSITSASAAASAPSDVITCSSASSSACSEVRLGNRRLQQHRRHKHSQLGSSVGALVVEPEARLRAGSCSDRKVLAAGVPQEELLVHTLKSLTALHRKQVQQVITFSAVAPVIGYTRSKTSYIFWSTVLTVQCGHCVFRPEATDAGE